MCQTAISLDDVTGVVVDAAVKLHKALGPGLLESVYELVLARDLHRKGLLVERQKPVSFEFDGMKFDDAFRVDLLVASCVVVEIKSVERPAPVHAKQLLTYLRLMNLPVGLLINFGAPILKQGLQRVVNGLAPSASPRLRVNQPSAARTRKNESRGGAERTCQTARSVHHAGVTVAPQSEQPRGVVCSLRVFASLRESNGARMRVDFRKESGAYPLGFRPTLSCY